MCPDLGLVGAFFLTEIPDFIRALFGSGASTEEGQPRFGGLSTDESMNGGGGAGGLGETKSPFISCAFMGAPFPKPLAPQPPHTHTHTRCSCLPFKRRTGALWRITGRPQLHVIICQEKHDALVGPFW